MQFNSKLMSYNYLLVLNIKSINRDDKICYSHVTNHVLIGKQNDTIAKIK